MKMTNGSGKIITFYSYKGGTGRSMAMSNVAWILASSGKRVLAIDWDLEAPGLHRYFYPFLVDKDLTSSEGVIDFIIDYSVAAMTPPETDEQLKNWYTPYANILRYATSLKWDFPAQGKLDFIPAGRQGQSYSTRVNSFDWQDFYGRLGGWTFLEAAKDKMRSEYDYILIDSRTGVSDTSGICTVQMPDVLVVCYLLNNQSIQGSAAVAASVYEQRKDSGLHVFPVPMRIENSEKEKRDLRKVYALDKFAPFSEHLPDKERELYRGKVQFPYIPYYAYEEILAAFGDDPKDTNTLLESAERLTYFLTEGSVRKLDGSTEAARREEVLSSYAQLPRAEESATSLREEKQGTPAMFLSLARFVRRALRRPIPLWLTAIFFLAALLSLGFTIYLGRDAVAQRSRVNEVRQQLSTSEQSLADVQAKLKKAEEDIEIAKDTELQFRLLKEQQKITEEQTKEAEKARQDAERARRDAEKQVQIANQQLRTAMDASRQAEMQREIAQEYAERAHKLQAELDNCRRTLKPSNP